MSGSVSLWVGQSYSHSIHHGKLLFLCVGTLPWCVMPTQTVKGRRWRVLMWISEGELKTQVPFGTHDCLEVAVYARDIAILAFRSDRLEEVKQSDE